MPKHETRLSSLEAIALGFVPKERKENSKNANPRYYLNDDQYQQLNKIRDFHNTQFKQVRRTLNEQGNVISSVEKLSPKELIDIPKNHEIKRVSTNVSTQQQWVITEPVKETKIDLEQIDFTKYFEGKITPIEINAKKVKQRALFDRAIITDVHVGMKVTDGYSLYEGIWNEEELFKRRDIFVNEIIKNQKSNLLLLHELGDFMDGYNGMTTRGGHELPQNMDNQKAFDVGLQFKISLIDALVHYYDKINIVNICNDNHAGSFGYIVNSAFKSYIELKYKNVVVINQRKFIDHYIIKNRCFIITHGKDEKSLKFGFKPHLDAVQIEKIKNYIDEYKLHNYQIEFGKGDSHQLLFDLTSSTAFEYQNFGAFSPPSDWVKVNFKNTKSSFTTMNYYENQKTINNYIF
jgi:hypothetical protein